MQLLLLIRSSVLLWTANSAYTTSNFVSFPLRRNMAGLSSISSSVKDEEKRVKDDTVTVLGFGSLLSESSSRTTFPNLTNFRLGRVPNYRRVFGHPASIFFQRGIANQKTKEMSSLCAEFEPGCGFVCSVFEVPNTLRNNERIMEQNGIPSQAFLEREEEFNIITAPYVELVEQENKIEEPTKATTTTGKSCEGEGILCTRWTDEGYLERWGSVRFETNYGQYGIDTIWGWKHDSGLRPCAVYLRHCVLAAKSMGSTCYDSFLDDTYLVDRTTTIRQYLDQYPHVMNSLPPPELAARYSG